MSVNYGFIILTLSRLDTLTSGLRPEVQPEVQR